VNLVELGYATGWRLVRTMPEAWADRLFRAAADRAHRRRGRGTQRLARNLRRVVGPQLGEAEFDALLRAALRSYARYWKEAFRLPSYSQEQIRTEFQIDRGHILGEAVESGTGVIIALSHSGNWDMAGAWVCSNGWGLTTVAERLKPEGVYQRFVDYRRGLGMEIIPTTGGERPPLDLLVEALGRAHVVPLLADRDLSARGIEVKFFDGLTRMPAGPALLALRTGAPLVVVPLWFEGPLNRGEVIGPLPVPPPDAGPLDERVRLLTQTMADELAAAIARHPADWHMLQKMWLDT
jgi:KDO2-lipid IV(A) lauroyltransferase